jgi:hypothetical protein
MSKLGKLCCTSRGFDLLDDLGNATSYLKGIQLHNNLPSSPFPLLLKGNGI